MRNGFLACLTFFGCIAAVHGQDQDAPIDVAPASSAPVEEVLVSGEQPGPGLWRVAKDDHVLWILGTHSPLPKKISWKSHEVESLVAESQEILLYGGISQRPNIGFFRGLTLLPSLFGAAKSPEGAKLQDLLPADVYARWLELKKKYIGKDQGIERWRPTFAMQELRSEALEKSGLAYRNSVRELVLKVAKQHKLKITNLRIEKIVEIDKPRDLLKRFSKTPFADVECFSQSIARLESDLEDLRASANAWSVGDVPKLRQLMQRDNSTDCLNILISAVLKGELTENPNEKQLIAKVVEENKRASEELATQWLAAADGALANNASTLAVVPISLLLAPEGYLDALKARGYSIEEP